MKRLSALLLLLPMLFCACAKAEEKSCAEIVSSVCTDLNADSYLLYGTSEEDGSIEQDLVLRLFSYSETPRAWMAVSDAALLLSTDCSGYEILLIRCRHSSEKTRVGLLLRRRLSLIQSAGVQRYMGEEYLRYLSSAGVYEFDDYLCLLSTCDNDTILEQLKKAAKSR